MTPTQTPIPELDALPLPKPVLHVAFSDNGEHIRFWTRSCQSAAVWDADNWPTEPMFSAMQYRAAHREGYELAMRKAQEGREPVFWYRVRSDGRYEGPIPNSSIEEVRKKSGAWTPLYAVSPPPKSDEAMDALIKAARWFADNPDSPKSALGHITEALAALAATRLAITRAAYEISKEMR